MPATSLINVIGIAHMGAAADGGGSLHSDDEMDADAGGSPTFVTAASNTVIFAKQRPLTASTSAGAVAAAATAAPNVFVNVGRPASGSPRRSSSGRGHHRPAPLAPIAQMTMSPPANAVSLASPLVTSDSSGGDGEAERLDFSAESIDAFRWRDGVGNTPSGRSSAQSQSTPTLARSGNNNSFTMSKAWQSSREIIVGGSGGARAVQPNTPTGAARRLPRGNSKRQQPSAFHNVANATDDGADPLEDVEDE